MKNQRNKNPVVTFYSFRARSKPNIYSQQNEASNRIINNLNVDCSEPFSLAMSGFTTDPDITGIDHQ